MGNDKKLEQFHLKFSEMTESVYVAKMNAKGDCALEKVERTQDFLEVLLAWCPPGYVREIANGDETIAFVAVTKRDPDSWAKVEDELPKTEGKYRIFHPDWGQEDGHFDGVKFDKGFLGEVQPTHWHSLRESPDIETKA